MEDILNLLTKILLITVLAVQLVVMIYLFYINHKRYKADKKFWKELDEAVKEQVARYDHLLTPDDAQSEQDKNQE